MSERTCTYDGQPCRSWAQCPEWGCTRERDAARAEEARRDFAALVRDLTPHETLPSGVKYRDLRTPEPR